MRFLVGLVTCPDIKSARKIAEDIVKNRLCACVNIIDRIQSVFFWENRVQKEKEVLLIIKTTAAKRVRLSRRIKKMHPYTVPEIIFVEIKHGSKDYLDWVRKETS